MNTSTITSDTPIQPPIQQQFKLGVDLPLTTLSTKSLFTHFFLIHDFLFRMVKSPSNNPRFFDLQIQVNDSMRKAAKIGGKAGQLGFFSALVFYCMKGRLIKLKLLYGFLYMYWIDHFYTLGSYAGILLRMSSVYHTVGEHFLKHEKINDENLFMRLNKVMETNSQYEDTQAVLNGVFKQQSLQQKNYVVNEYFAKNKDKYFTHEEGTLVQRPSMKLKYLDCFLTRYVYYTFARWYQKKLNSWGLVKGF